MTDPSAIPIEHDAPGNDVPHGYSVEHPPRVLHAAARRVRPHQRGADEPVAQRPDPDGRRVRAPHVRASTVAASRGAEQGGERAGPRRGQARAAEARAGREGEARSGGGGGADGDEVGAVGVRVGRRRRRDGVAAAEEGGVELAQVVVVVPRARFHVATLGGRVGLLAFI